MIRAVLLTTDGPVVVLGIVQTNIDRIRDGQPLVADIGELLKIAGGENLPTEGKLRVCVMYGRTHRAIIDEINTSAPEGAGQLPPEYTEAADRLDEQLRVEGLMV